MTNLLDGGGWWAMVEQVGASHVTTYWKVVAWESVSDHLTATDGRGLVAWVNGREPVRSDRFHETVNGWILNQFVPALPEGAKTDSWA